MPVVKSLLIVLLSILKIKVFISIGRRKMETLRKKFVNPNLVNKTCSTCKKTYPRTKEFFYLHKGTKKYSKNYVRFDPYCITCQLKRSLEWKRKNKDRKRISGKKYNESERGYLVNLFNSMKKSCHYVESEFPDKESLIQHWKEQKDISGWICPATGETMTTIQLSKNGEFIKNPTNISKDRILCFEPYTKKNLMFTTWKYNNDKNATTPKMAKAILRITKERYGTDEME